MYEFNEDGHVHLLDGKPLHGVTTVLRVIAKPALIQWAANMAVDHIKNNYAGNLTEELLKEARMAHRTKKEKAGDWGTKLHEAIESYIKGGTMPDSLDAMGLKALYKFKSWADDNKIKFLASEKHLYSRELWIGGICDLIFEMDGKKYVGDIKTSSGIYDEAFFQMGAYDLMLEEMGIYNDIAGYMVINLKKDGTMETKLANNTEVNRQAFLHALGLHKIIGSLK